jgi:hypothetical protein
VTTPVQKDALLKAVADLLAAAAGAKLKADGNLEQRTAKEAKRPKPRSATKRTATEPNIIELVDVVEEVADHSETSALQD